eukprot:gene2327-2795_t
MNQLFQLKELLTNKLITQEEYQIKKTMIIDKMTNSTYSPKNKSTPNPKFLPSNLETKPQILKRRSDSELESEKTRKNQVINLHGSTNAMILKEKCYYSTIVNRIKE